MKFANFPTARTAMICLAISLISASASSQEKPAEKPVADKKPANALDKELLKGLGDDPLSELIGEGEKLNSPENAKPAGNEPPKPVKPKAVDDLDKQLLEGLGVGEDTGESGDPLVRAGRNMRTAGERIGQAKTDEETQALQKKILADLDQLIKQARQQQQQQQSTQSQQQTAKREQVKQASRKPSEGNRKPSDQPASDSSEQLGNAELEKADPGQVLDLLKQRWGQYAPKDREMMLWNAKDKFLPKYEPLIEEYFKALIDREKKS